MRSSNNASWIYIYIHINRGKNSSLFSNWNNSILHARDLSFRDYASSSPRNIYIYTYTCTRLFKYLRSRSYIISARFHDEKDIYLLYEDNVNNLFLPVISI